MRERKAEVAAATPTADAAAGAASGTRAAATGTRGGATRPAAAGRAAGAALGEGLARTPPAVGPEVRQVFLPVTVGATGAALEIESRFGAEVTVEDQSIVYRPGLLGVGSVHFLHKKSGARTMEELALLTQPGAGSGVRWDEAEHVAGGLDEAEGEPVADAAFGHLPEAANQPRELKSAEKDLADYLYRSRRMTLLGAPAVDEFSEPGETPEAFRLRLEQAARERRDEEVDKIEDRYEKQLTRLGERLRRAQMTLGKRESEASARKREGLVAIGESVVGMFLGRRSSRTASTSLRRLRMTSSAKMRVEEAEENVEALQAEVEQLNERLAEEVAEITARWDHGALEVEEIEVAPRRTDVDVEYVAIAWAPHRRVAFRTPDGETQVEEILAYRS